MIAKLLNNVSPVRIAALTLLILATNALEVLGISMFIPVIDLFQGKGAAATGITRLMSDVVSRLGLPAVLTTFLLLLCLLFLVKGGLMLWMRHLSVKLAAAMQDRLRRQLVEKLLGATVGFVNAQKQGALLSVVGEHSVRIGQLFFLLVQMTAQWMTVLAYLAFVLWVSWKLTAAALVLGAALAPLVRGMGLKAHRHGKEYTQTLEETQHHVLESLQAKKLVNAMNWNAPLEQRFRERSAVVSEHWQWMAFWSSGPGVVIQPVSVVVLSLIIWLSLRFDLSVAMLGAFALAFIRLLPAVQSAISMGADLQANRASVDRVFGLLESAAAAAEPGGHMPFRTLERRIRLEGVHYRYPGRDPILTGMSLEIPKGATVALVGQSGAGKTTIADLIVGLYRPEAGRILVDDTDLAAIDLRQYRARIAYVSQDPVLFHDTIRNNLTLGLEREVNDGELREACEQAGAWEFVAKRAEGLDAVVGDRGVQLSGGQRQRLVLARALLRQPEILILDEATSALDQESEQWIARTLAALQSGRHLTIVIIAHRYTTIQHADLIIEIRKEGANRLGNWAEARQYLMREGETLTLS